MRAICSPPAIRRSSAGALLAVQRDAIVGFDVLVGCDHFNAGASQTVQRDVTAVTEVPDGLAPCCNPCVLPAPKPVPGQSPGPVLLREPTLEPPSSPPAPGTATTVGRRLFHEVEVKVVEQAHVPRWNHEQLMGQKQQSQEVFDAPSAAPIPVSSTVPATPPASALAPTPVLEQPREPVPGRVAVEYSDLILGYERKEQYPEVFRECTCDEFTCVCTSPPLDEEEDSGRYLTQRQYSTSDEAFRVFCMQRHQRECGLTAFRPPGPTPLAPAPVPPHVITMEEFFPHDLAQWCRGGNILSMGSFMDTCYQKQQIERARQQTQRKQQQKRQPKHKHRKKKQQQGPQQEPEQQQQVQQQDQQQQERKQSQQQQRQEKKQQQQQQQHVFFLLYFIFNQVWAESRILQSLMPPPCHRGEQLQPIPNLRQSTHLGSTEASQDWPLLCYGRPYEKALCILTAAIRHMGGKKRTSFWTGCALTGQVNISTAPPVNRHMGGASRG